eukprot:CAMPEP_0177628486 /NCGR_PEP_ID=MMETSP0447-20121125/158_1 /TAXON_ID=0 /ORGANISM="Stygamoeba regulata, Strain BSH-02190019" /LENGTH=475 /DNA_ID=CAMNT_0019129739 /DNA_START=94 /DNA_END=1522 /DNA_ORIENTATION=+
MSPCGGAEPHVLLPAPLAPATVCAGGHPADGLFVREPQLHSAVSACDLLCSPGGAGDCLFRLTLNVELAPPSLFHSLGGSHLLVVRDEDMETMGPALSPTFDQLLAVRLCHPNKLGVLGFQCSTEECNSRHLSVGYPTGDQWLDLQPARTSPKEAFVRKARTERNWRTLTHTEQMVQYVAAREEDMPLPVCFFMDGDRLAFGLEDGRVVCTHIGRPDEPLTLDFDSMAGSGPSSIHPGGAMSVMMDSTKIVSAGIDCTIKIWDASARMCKETLCGHSRFVLVACFDRTDPTNPVLLSGANDRTIRMWDMHTAQCVHTFTGHESAVLRLQFDQEMIVSGSNDSCIRVWDPRTGKCCHTLLGHVRAVSGVQFDMCKLISTSWDGTLNLWDTRTWSCYKSIMAHPSSAIYRMQFDATKIVTGGEDKCVRVWEPDTGALLAESHCSEQVFRLQFDQTKMCVGMDNMEVIPILSLWHFDQ